MSSSIKGFFGYKKSQEKSIENMNFLDKNKGLSLDLMSQ